MESVADRVNQISKNQVLLKAILKQAPNVLQFCRKHGRYYDYVKIGALINCKLMPITQYGRWRRICIRLAEILDCLPEKLFPLAQYYTMNESKNSAIKEIIFSNLPEKSLQEIKKITAPETPFEIVVKQELAVKMPCWLKKNTKCLTDNERQCLIMYYGLEDQGKRSNVEIANRIGYTPRSIRQHVYNAIQKLRNNSSFIRQFGKYIEA